MPDIDVIPAVGPNGPVTATRDPYAARQRWRLLLVSFLVCAVIGLTYVWLRAPIFQSYAILHLSYDQPHLEGVGALADEQLNIHRQRLISPTLLGQLSNQLREQQQIMLSQERLVSMLRVETIANSRLLKLTATGTAPELLQPVVTQWVNLYNSAQTGEQQDEATKTLAALRGKAAQLEQKIATQRNALAEFAATHEIVSLERDENRILNQIKGLSRSLDTAVEEKAAAAGQLQAIEAAIAAGKVVVRPQDQRSLDNMEDRALALEEQLFQLAQQYTTEYMALDPKIVAIENNLDALRNKIDSRRRESQAAYRNEAEQTLRSASLKEAEIKNQLQALQRQAQQFSQKLSEYNSRTSELEQLEQQLQLVQEQRIEEEVRKPYHVELVVLEPPLPPEFPVGPAYGRDTGLVVFGSLLLALLTVVIYSLMNRQQNGGMSFASYAVIRPEQKPLNTALNKQAYNQLGYREPQVLSTEDCRALLQEAPLHCRLMVQLLLSGVDISELSSLKAEDFDAEQQLLSLSGPYQRQLLLPEVVATTWRRVAEAAPSGALWQDPTGEQLTMAELEAMLRHSSGALLGAGREPPTMRDLRVTYLLFLARQGATLNQIEQIAGYLSAADMENCRQLAADRGSIDLPSLATQHPALQPT